jgi:hypothetical protein
VISLARPKRWALLALPAFGCGAPDMRGPASRRGGDDGLAHVDGAGALRTRRCGLAPTWRVLAPSQSSDDDIGPSAVA